MSYPKASIKIELDIPRGAILCNQYVDWAAGQCDNLSLLRDDSGRARWTCDVFGGVLEQDEHGRMLRCQCCLDAEVKE